MTRDHARLDRYRKLSETGTLKLSQPNWRWVWSMVERGIAARGKVLADPSGLPESVILALETPQPRQRRVRGIEP